jgi:hypothetical protein
MCQTAWPCADSPVLQLDALPPWSGLMLLQIGDVPDETAPALVATRTPAIIVIAPASSIAAPNRRVLSEIPASLISPPTAHQRTTDHSPRQSPLPLGSRSVARIDVPEGEGGEAVQIWTLWPG